jgi:hypothetical protein
LRTRQKTAKLARSNDDLTSQETTYLRLEAESSESTPREICSLLHANIRYYFWGRGNSMKEKCNLIHFAMFEIVA